MTTILFMLTYSKPGFLCNYSLGAGGRRFESFYPDYRAREPKVFMNWTRSYMAGSGMVE